jgi:hypothetical protein
VDALSIAASVVCCGVLLLGAVTKLANPKPAGETVAALIGGFDRPQAIGIAVAATELAGAIVVAVAKPPVAAGVVLAFGLGFAGAGARARSIAVPLKCNCLGRASSSSALGLRQLALLPLWFAGASAIIAGTSSDSRPFWVLSCSALAVAVVSGSWLSGEALHLRARRLQEAALWK